MDRIKIENVLLAMGISAGIKGFSYIADTIEVFEERGTNIFITKELYPTIAKKRNTTLSKVERAIRYAFKSARDCKEKKEIVEYYIGFIDCKNSNSLKQLYLILQREKGGECNGKRIQN